MYSVFLFLMKRRMLHEQFAMPKQVSENSGRCGRIPVSHTAHRNVNNLELSLHSVHNTYKDLKSGIELYITQVINGFLKYFI
jgi:hypothetical protein